MGRVSLTVPLTMSDQVEALSVASAVVSGMSVGLVSTQIMRGGVEWSRRFWGRPTVNAWRFMRSSAVSTESTVMLVPMNASESAARTSISGSCVMTVSGGP